MKACLSSCLMHAVHIVRHTPKFAMLDYLNLSNRSQSLCTGGSNSTIHLVDTQSGQPVPQNQRPALEPCRIQQVVLPRNPKVKMFHRDDSRLC
jgi:hypothetical protein